MAIRLQEMHPALVHFPVALLPLAVAADAVGSLTGNQSAFSFGQVAICIAAIGAIGAAVTGLVAGEEVNVKGRSQDMLITHRNLNFIATVVATGMAIWRINEGKPSAGYFVAGAAGICILAYTAYLGGKLVYSVGVGVDPAHGVYRADAPALKSGQIVSFIKTAATDLLHGVQHMVEEVAKGRLIPTIMGSPRKQPEGPDAPMAGEPK
jgi:uncharacterized membrane protein